MCKGGGGNTSTSTTQTTSQPQPFIQAAGQQALGQAQSAAQQPFQSFQGPMVAGFTPMQQSGFNEVNQAQGTALPFINSGAQFLAQGTSPIQVPQFSGQALQGFFSPFQNDVINTTAANINETNAEQLNQLRGNAVSQGAWGGDRAGVAEAELARQQALAGNQTLAGLENQGFNTALGEFNTQSQMGIGAQQAQNWLAENAGSVMANLGPLAQGSIMSGAAGQLSAGNLQQQLAQEQLNIPFEQFVAQQAFPFQKANFLAGNVEGIGGAMGGTSTAQLTEPDQSAAANAGLGIAGLGALGSFGQSAFGPGFLNSAARGGRIFRKHADTGGVMQSPTTSSNFNFDFGQVPSVPDPETGGLRIPMPNPSGRGMGIPAPVMPRSQGQAMGPGATLGMARGYGGGGGGGAPGGGGGGWLSNLFGSGGQNGATSTTSSGGALIDPGSAAGNPGVAAADAQVANLPAQAAPGFGSVVSDGSGVIASDVGTTSAADLGLSGLESGSTATIEDLGLSGLLSFRRGGRTHMAQGGDPLSGLLKEIPGFDPQSATIGDSPDQHNRDLGYGGQAIGTVIGGFFGGPGGAMGGGLAGKKIGLGAGNMIAGRDFYNGAHGDFWDNLNPFSKYGAASIGQSLNMGMLPQTMMGSMGGLPGMGGGGIGLPGLAHGGRTRLAGGGTGGVAVPQAPDIAATSPGGAVSAINNPAINLPGVSSAPILPGNSQASQNGTLPSINFGTSSFTGTGTPEGAVQSFTSSPRGVPVPQLGGISGVTPNASGNVPITPMFQWSPPAVSQNPGPGTFSPFGSTPPTPQSIGTNVGSPTGTAGGTTLPSSLTMPLSGFIPASFRRGGPVRRGYDMGGDISASGAALSGAPVGGGNPISSAYMNRLTQMNPEQLQEMSVLYGGQNPMIQRALMMSRMQPPQMQMQAGAPQTGPMGPTGTPGPAAPSMQAPGGLGVPQNYTHGGRAGYDDGGDITGPWKQGSDLDYTRDTPAPPPVLADNSRNPMHHTPIQEGPQKNVWQTYRDSPLYSSLHQFDNAPPEPSAPPRHREPPAMGPHQPRPPGWLPGDDMAPTQPMPAAITNAHKSLSEWWNQPPGKEFEEARRVGAMNPMYGPSPKEAEVALNPPQEMAAPPTAGATPHTGLRAKWDAEQEHLKELRAGLPSGAAAAATPAAAPAPAKETPAATSKPPETAAASPPRVAAPPRHGSAAAPAAKQQPPAGKGPTFEENYSETAPKQGEQKQQQQASVADKVHSAYPQRSPWELMIALGAGMASSRSPHWQQAVGAGLNEMMGTMEKGREEELKQYNAEKQAKQFGEHLELSRKQLDAMTEMRREAIQQRQDAAVAAHEDRGERNRIYDLSVTSQNAERAWRDNQPIGFTPEGYAVYPGERVGKTKMIPKQGAGSNPEQVQRDRQAEIDKRAVDLGLNNAFDMTERQAILDQAERDVDTRRGDPLPGRLEQTPGTFKTLNDLNSAVNAGTISPADARKISIQKGWAQ